MTQEPETEAAPAGLLERLRQSEAARQDLQKTLAERDAQLAAAQREAEEFQRMVAHDLRAPLRHVLAFSKMAREMHGEGEDPSASLDTVERSARLLGRMIDGLLELTRLGRAELTPCTLPFATLLHEARREAEAVALAAAPGRQIEWQIADDLPSVYGDPAQLRTLWSQLLDNALKYTRSCAPARIEIGWQTVAGGVCLHVRDNGVGFRAEQAAQLFSPFYRLHSAQEFEGLGLGLALARQIARRHGGTVKAEAVEGHGCTASVTLPSGSAAAS